MPAIDPSIALLLTVRQDIAISTLGDNSTLSPPPPAPLGLPIVCAWPVSGQYGFGTRILYYLLIAACVIARKLEWIRNACLAAALLFPVTAAIHGIVLAAAHNENAVDMDIYGALQLCAIGVFVAPVSVRLSSTYNKSEGRNLIFAWSGIILAGLISLVVEFYRTNPALCLDYNGKNLTSPKQFPYNDTTFTCNLECNVNWPQSPIRLGSSNNIYVIPAPTVMTFHTAMSIAALACIPAVLLPASILRQNYRKKDLQQPAQEAPKNSSQVSPRECLHKWNKSDAEHIELVSETGPPLHDGQAIAESQVSAHAETTAAERRDEKWRSVFKSWPLGVVFVLLFLAMLGFGEANLWSYQVYYQTDYMANVGQWAPLAGSGLAITGSAYLLVTHAMDTERKKMEADTQQVDDTLPEEPERSSELRAVDSEGKSRASAATSSINNVTGGTGSRSLQLAARYLVMLSDKLGDWGASSVKSIRSGLEKAQLLYPDAPGEGLRNPNIARIHTFTSSQRPSIESHRSGTSRPRSDTLTSNTSRQGRARSSSDIEPTKRERRDTLDVPKPRRPTQSSLPRPSLTTLPPEVYLPTPNSQDHPQIVISPDPT